jgi:hypothetical protein
MTYDEFWAALAQHESGQFTNPNGIKNPYGYLGKYQMGEGALIDVGFFSLPCGMQWNGTNDFGQNGRWTALANQFGVNSADDFLNSPAAQEYAARVYAQVLWKYIQRDSLDQWIGQTVSGVQITASGLIAGAWLVGVPQLREYLRSNGSVVPTDENKTPVTQYIQDMGGANGPFER